MIDWIEQCLKSPPTQYRLYGRVLQVKRLQPTASKYTEGKNATKENPEKANNTK